MIYLNSVLDSTQQKASENMHLTELPKKSWAPYSEHVVSSICIFRWNIEILLILVNTVILSNIRVRKNYSTLIYGDFLDLEPSNEKLYIYKRWDKQKTFIIVLNFSNDKTQWDIYNFDSMRLVISNYKKSAYTKSVDPWEARVYIC